VHRRILILGGGFGGVYAALIGCVGPAVVGADQILPLDPSQGERCAAVDAQVFERDDPILDPEDDDLLVKQAHSERLFAKLAAGCHRMPVVS